MAVERRSNSRVAVELSVKVRLPDGGVSTSETIRNVSLGGVFIQMANPLPFGAEVALEFSLTSPSRTIRCKGFVVWSTKTNPEKSAQPGIGVRLMDIGITDMRVLNEFVARQLSP